MRRTRGWPATATRLLPVVASVVASGVLVSACGAPPARSTTATTGMPPPSAAALGAPSSTPTTASPAPTPTATPAATPTTPPTAPPTAPATPTPTTTGPTPSDGTPVLARLSIPALGLDRLVVEPYEGWTDDAPGTRIQDRGRAASPFGPGGGTGPGGVGSYQVTGHRTSAQAPFRDLPGLVDGAQVHVDAGGVRYTYAVTETRRTSFRSAASLAEQRAAVPGRPGVPPTQAVILLSTCATPEDHAAGNYWSDAQHNPEHRIDKVGTLVATGPAPA